MVNQIEELHLRLDKLEKQKNQEVVTLVEILANANFFVCDKWTMRFLHFAR
jgi:hypothetical protein